MAAMTIGLSRVFLVIASVNEQVVALEGRRGRFRLAARKEKARLPKQTGF
jgi:hypothetical protein